MENEFQSSIIEALILASPEPLPARKIMDVVDDTTAHKIGGAVAALNNRYMQAGSSFRIRELAGGYQFYVVPEFAGYVQELFTRRRKMRMTRASLETMAITAYRQPVTKAEIEHIRGVASDGVLHNLLEKKLVRITGRAKTVGKPLQYGTTDEFLKFFGLATLKELPKMSEIEELIRSQEPQNQTELQLNAEGLADAAQKLNIADGTFTPEDATESDESPVQSDDAPEPPSETNVADDTEIANADTPAAPAAVDEETSVEDAPDDEPVLVAEPDEPEQSEPDQSEPEAVAVEAETVGEEQTGVIVDMDATGDRET